MALSQGKKTVQGTGRGRMTLGLTAAAIVFQGGIAMLVSGFVRAARIGQGGNDFAKIADVALDRVVGVGLDSLTGGASDGALSTDVQSGDWLFKNSAGVDAITVASVGHYCFVIDDETVARTSASGTRPRAGVIVGIDATGVMVRMSPEIAAAAPRSIFLPFTISEADTLAGASTELVSPVSGTITRQFVTVQKAVTTGGTVSALVGATAVAGLSIAVANGATKGTTGTGTPTAGDATAVVAAGGRIQILTAGFATAGAVSGLLEIGF